MKGIRRFIGWILAAVLLTVPLQAESTEKYVALTFDDGPSGRYTQRLLEGLKARDVKATFLLCGYRMEQFPDLTERIPAEGHEVGFHGYSHDNMSTMSRRKIAEELEKSGLLLPKGCSPVFLRPPGGAVSDGVRQVAEVRLLGILKWSVDPRDWDVHDAQLVIDRVLKTVKDGDVILLHDMSDSSVTAALEIVDTLQKQGYHFVTVSQLAELRGVRIRPGEIYERFPQSSSKPCA